MAAGTTAAGAVLKAWWPVILTAGAGLIGFGSLRTDVQQLKSADSVRVSDHELIVRMDERQTRLQKDVAEMKQDVKDIAKAVK